MIAATSRCSSSRSTASRSFQGATSVSAACAALTPGDHATYTAPGYHADIDGNNARNGWTEDTPATNDAEAERRAKELAAHLDEMARGRRTAR